MCQPDQDQGWPYKTILYCKQVFEDCDTKLRAHLGNNGDEKVVNWPPSDLQIFSTSTKLTNWQDCLIFTVNSTAMPKVTVLVLFKLKVKAKTYYSTMPIFYHLLERIVHTKRLTVFIAKWYIPRKKTRYHVDHKTMRSTRLLPNYSYLRLTSLECTMTAVVKH
ncbi:hypothetical protein P5673_008964 [Acropora cervicornis]|uniref:Uncharacterized protein n=1 Tax=Acropora cervicornis TaxID=6130 RepID=A0AAD9QU57_ACRCE|nr:hypothetical protein P5673_008964 [Acropora cervicornis]